MPEKTTYTYADLATFPDEDLLRREIIDGELIVSPAPRMRHQKVSGRLYKAISRHTDDFSALFAR